MASKRTNPDFLNGVPELLILRLLARSPMYGYQLVESIRLCSGEVFEFGEGCIYPILHRLEADRIVTGERTTVNGRSRVTYTLTSRGQRRLEDSTKEWRMITSAISSILEGANHAALPMGI